jgi:hypothetical protein
MMAISGLSCRAAVSSLTWGSRTILLIGFGMAKSDPTKDPEFKRVLGNLLKAPPKPHADMKIGRTAKKAAAARKKKQTSSTT